MTLNPFISQVKVFLNKPIWGYFEYFKQRFVLKRDILVKINFINSYSLKKKIPLSFSYQFVYLVVTYYKMMRVEKNN